MWRDRPAALGVELVASFFNEKVMIEKYEKSFLALYIVFVSSYLQGRHKGGGGAFGQNVRCPLAEGPIIPGGGLKLEIVLGPLYLVCTHLFVPSVI